MGSGHPPASDHDHDHPPAADHAHQVSVHPRNRLRSIRQVRHQHLLSFCSGHCCRWRWSRSRVTHQPLYTIRSLPCWPLPSHLPSNRNINNGSSSELCDFYPARSPTMWLLLWMFNPIPIPFNNNILSATPKPMSVVPRGTLTFLATILGFPALSAFGKFARIGFPSSTEHC